MRCGIHVRDGSRVQWRATTKAGYVLTQESDVPTYETPPDKKKQVGIRYPMGLIDDLKDVVRLWKMFAAHRKENVAGVDFSFVVLRLLRMGVDNAFAEIGFRPHTEVQWKQAAKAVEKAVGK